MLDEEVDFRTPGFPIVKERWWYAAVDKGFMHELSIEFTNENIPLEASRLES